MTLRRTKLMALVPDLTVTAERVMILVPGVISPLGFRAVLGRHLQRNWLRLKASRLPYEVMAVGTCTPPDSDQVRPPSSAGFCVGEPGVAEDSRLPC